MDKNVQLQKKSYIYNWLQQLTSMISGGHSFLRFYDVTHTIQ